VQGTVARFDPERHDATVLLDDGTSVDIPPEAFEASGLRLLRFGQRVRIVRDDGRIVEVALITADA